MELAQFCTAAFLDNPDKVTELFPQDCARYLESSLAACLSSSDRFVLHGPFNELCPPQSTCLVLEITEKRYRQAIDRAVSPSCPKLVLHAGFVPLVYHPSGSSAFGACVEAADAGGAGNATVCLENVREPDETMLLEILRQVDSPQLKLCLDLGHANTTASRRPPVQWLRACAPYLSPRTFTQQRRWRDLHAPLDQGAMDIAGLLTELSALCPRATVTLELGICRQSVEWLAAQNLLEE